MTGVPQRKALQSHLPAQKWGEHPGDSGFLGLTHALLPCLTPGWGVP